MARALRSYPVGLRPSVVARRVCVDCDEYDCTEEDGSPCSCPCHTEAIMSGERLGVDCCGDRYPSNTTVRCRCGCGLCYCRTCYQEHMAEIGKKHVARPGLALPPEVAAVEGERDAARQAEDDLCSALNGVMDIAGIPFDETYAKTFRNVIQAKEQAEAALAEARAQEARLREAARRGLVYVELFRQRQTSWNGNAFDDEQYIKAALTPPTAKEA